MDYRNEPALDNNSTIIAFTTNNSDLIKFKQQIIGQTENGETKDAEIMVSLKYVNNFWRSL